MAYRRINLLKKIVEIQNLTLEHTKRGVSQKWVYDNLISERYHISLPTYYNYLGCAAKAELRELSELKIEN